MHLSTDTQELLFFIIRNRGSNGIFSEFEKLKDNFTDIPDHLAILIQEELITVKYASNMPYFATVTGKGLNYNFNLLTQKEVEKRHNLWYPLIVSIVSFALGFAAGKLF